MRVGSCQVNGVPPPTPSPSRAAPTPPLHARHSANVTRRSCSSSSITWSGLVATRCSSSPQSVPAPPARSGEIHPPVHLEHLAGHVAADLRIGERADEVRHVGGLGDAADE